jgi:hypothetical protein
MFKLSIVSSDAKIRAIIVVPADDISQCEIFRTYRSRQSSINCTLIEALCASLAVPPLFDPVRIGPKSRQRMFIGGAVGFYNPARQILKEATQIYGDDQRVALILSLGSGAPPTMSLDRIKPPSYNIESLVNCIATDCQRVAREMDSQLIQVDTYVRLNVNRGLEDSGFSDWSYISSMESCIKSYLHAASVDQTVETASEKITKRIGSVTLAQLSTVIYHTSSHIILKSIIDRSTRIRYTAKPIPSVSPYYVVRENEWNAMNHHLVDAGEKRKIFAITGMGGCGKTQMVAYFAEQHRKR